MANDPMVIPYIGADGKIRPLPDHMIDRFAEELGVVANKLNSNLLHWARDAKRKPGDYYIVDDLLAAQLSWLVGHRGGDSTEARQYLRFAFADMNADTCASNVVKALNWRTTQPIALTRPWFFDRWFENNCPVVRLDERTAAGLALTSLPKSVDYEDVKLPWRAFKIILPHKLIPSTKKGAFYSSVEFHIETEAPVSGSRSYFLTSLDDTRHVDQVVRNTFKELVCPSTWEMLPEAEDIKTWINGLGNKFAEGDEEELLEFIEKSGGVAPKEYRTISLLIARIVCGAILFMTQPNVLRRKVQRDKPRWRQVQRDKEPHTTDYILLPPSEMKFPDPAKSVAAILALVRGENRARNIQLLQWMVRGHWRNQAHGSRLQERKWIWIAPYWKGPDDSKRVIRERNVTHREAT